VHHPAKTQKQIVSILRSEGLSNNPYEASDSATLIDEASE
jgi:hypothetical protein